MGSVVAHQIGELLERARCHPRGNRHDCSKCDGLRTITHSEEAFYCHKCQWKGNAVTLEKELGVYQRVPSAEYRAQREKQERAQDAAARLYHAIRARRMQLLDLLHDLNWLEAKAHDAGPTEAAWDSLAIVYRERPGIEAELDFLESASAAELAGSLTGGSRDVLNSPTGLRGP